jgi:hypothetical protein
MFTMNNIPKLIERLRNLSAYGCCLEAAEVLERWTQPQGIVVTDLADALTVISQLQARVNAAENPKP